MITSRCLLRGKAEFPKGCRTIYGVCEHGGRVDVLPFNPDQNGLIVHQYCYMQQENLRWQIPIGEIPPGELPEQDANVRGRVVVMDWDFDSARVDHPDRELTRRLLHWRNDHHGGNNWSGHQLWRYLHSAGLRRLSIHPWVTIARFEADGLTQSLWRAAEVACAGGAVSPAEHETWIKESKSRIQAGTFFASLV